MRIIAIDPGYERVGIAIIEKNKNEIKEKLIFSDCFRTSPKLPISERIFIIGKEISSILKKFKPETLAIENLFMNSNQKTAMAVSEVRGVIIYESMKYGLKVFEYTPLQIKSAVTGHGRASKEQIYNMAKRLIEIPISKNKKLDDEIDAIAIGITHFAFYKNVI